MEENKNKNKGALFGACFLAWFILSMVGMIFFSKSGNTPVVAMLFGQYFLVFGIMAMISGKGVATPVGLLIALIGVAVVVISFLRFWGPNFGIEVDTDRIIIILIPAFFALIGMVITWVSLYKRIVLKSSCDTQVQAECVDVKSKLSRSKKHGSTMVYMPIFLFEYNSEKYVVDSGIYSNVGVVSKGDTLTLHINSSNPRQFYYDDMLKVYIIPIVLGILFMLVGILVLLLAVFGG